MNELFKSHKGVVWATIVALLAVVACIDYITGIEISFSIFYLIPISLAAWYVGLWAGVLTSAVGAITWFIVDFILGRHLYPIPAVGYWNSLLRFGFFIIITVILSRLSHSLGAKRGFSNGFTRKIKQVQPAGRVSGWAFIFAKRLFLAIKGRYGSQVNQDGEARSISLFRCIRIAHKWQLRLEKEVSDGKQNPDHRRRYGYAAYPRRAVKSQWI